MTQQNTQASSTRKTRYALCGLSTRGIYHFLLPLIGKSVNGNTESYSDCSEVVGILDMDGERVQEFCKRMEVQIPWYSTEQGVDTMIRETKPDVLLVAGPDYTHYEHIMAGLKYNLRVIAEKPVVINAEQMRDVLAAEQKSSGSLTVAHNYRYGTTSRRIKELLMQDKIGRITNIEFVYNLDTRHGASYYYRWNRERAKSGGLSIHKSVHHLDFINWLIRSTPETVFAFGARNYYGPNGAHRPRSADGTPLTDLAQVRAACPYFQQHYAAEGQSPDGPVTPGWDALQLDYKKQYPKDRYIYDEEIDVEDTYSAVVRFQNGASMTYSCNFSTPWEGYILGINGTKGRLEVSHRSDPDPTGAPPRRTGDDKIVIMPLFGGREEYTVQMNQGGHGGADPLIRRDLFVGVSQESLDLELPADSYAGAIAIATGEAIWRSGVEGRPFTIKELLGEFYRD